MDSNIQLRIGSDLTSLSKFERSAAQGGSTFLEKIFFPEELHAAEAVSQLAGMFAAKEAVIKALDLEGGSWRRIRISRTGSGRPVCELVDDDMKIISHDVTISHDGDYAYASAVFMLHE